MVNPNTTAEQADGIIRSAWAAHGGIGDPPPLFVSRLQYEQFIKAGVNPDRLRIVEEMPL